MSGSAPPSSPLPTRPKNALFHPSSSPQEELRVQVGSLSRRLAEVEEERDKAGREAQQLQKLLAESEEGNGGGSLGCVLPPHSGGFGVTWGN